MHIWLVNLIHSWIGLISVETAEPTGDIALPYGICNEDISCCSENMDTSADILNSIRRYLADPR